MVDDKADALGARLPSLQRLADALTCRICCNLYAGPVLLRCGHTYCSSCIRSNLDYKLRNHGQEAQTCPECRTHVGDTQSGSLTVNYALREAVVAYQEALPQLTALVLRPQSVEQQLPGRLVERSRRTTPARACTQRNTPAAPQATSPVEYLILDDDVVSPQPRRGQAAAGQGGHPAAGPSQAPSSDAPPVPSHSQQGDADTSHTVAACALSGEQKRLREAGEQVAVVLASHQKRLRGGPATEGTRGGDGVGADPPPAPLPVGQTPPAMPPRPAKGCVACPVCGGSVTVELINDHLNVCLERSTAGGTAPSTTQPHQHGTAGTAQLANQPASQRAPSMSARAVGGRNAGGLGAGNVAGPHMGRQGRQGVTSKDVPPRLVFTVLSDKEARAKLKGAGLVVDKYASKKGMEEMWVSYRRYVQVKVDEGSGMDLDQVRASFLAHHRQQAAARSAGPGTLAALPAVKRASVDGMGDGARHGVYCIDVDGARGGGSGAGAEAGPAASARGRSTHSVLIAEARRRRDEALQPLNGPKQLAAGRGEVRGDIDACRDSDVGKLVSDAPGAGLVTAASASGGYCSSGEVAGGGGPGERDSAAAAASPAALAAMGWADAMLGGRGGGWSELSSGHEFGEGEEQEMPDVDMD